MPLRTQIAKGFIWTSIGTLGNGLVNFILTIILARLLTPYDYGILELLTIFVILSNTFVDSGFSQAVIRDKNASNTDLSSVFYLNLSIAIVIYLILFFAAPLIAKFYRDQNLIPLSRFVFITIIFESLTIIQNANYARTMRFKPQALATVIAMTIAGTIAIILAFKGFGYWALAFNLVTYSFLKMILFWLQSDWRPRLVFSRGSVHKYFVFGSNLLIQGIIDKFVSNLESLLIGRVYTKSELGNFSQARKLDTYIFQSLTSVIQKVTYPSLSQLDQGQNLKEAYRKIFKSTMLVLIPLLFFLTVMSESFILVIYGDKWVGAIPYFRLWCICGFFVCFYSIYINVILVKGKSRLFLLLSIIRQTLRVLAIILLLQKGVIYILYGILAVTIVSTILYVYAGSSILKYKIKEIVSDLMPIILYSAISVSLSYSIGCLLNIRLLWLFIIQILVMLLSYWGILIASKNRTYLELKQLFLTIFSEKRNTKAD